MEPTLVLLLNIGSRNSQPRSFTFSPTCSLRRIRIPVNSFTRMSCHASLFNQFTYVFRFHWLVPVTRSQAVFHLSAPSDIRVTPGALNASVLPPFQILTKLLPLSFGSSLSHLISLLSLSLNFLLRNRHCFKLQALWLSLLLLSREAVIISSHL